eukprot:27725_1
MSCNIESTATTFKLDIESKTWDLPAKESISYGSYSCGDLMILIRFYPHGICDNTKFCSVGVAFRAQSDDFDASQDQAKYCITWKCGSIIRECTQKANQLLGSQWGFNDFATIEYIKKNPQIFVTFKIISNPNFVIPSDNKFLLFEHQHQLLYEFCKLDGDIHLNIITDDNDGDIEVPSPNKKRRLNNDETNDDGGIQVLDKQIKANSIILKSGSPVFRNMLSANMMEQSKKEVTVYAKSVKDVDDLIYYMCTNQLKMDSNAMNLFHLANFYQMKRLKYECLNKITSDLSVDNFVDVIHLFDRYMIKEGYNVLIDFAQKNTDKLQKHDRFDELSHAFKMGVLGLGT